MDRHPAALTAAGRSAPLLSYIPGSGNRAATESVPGPCRKIAIRPDMVLSASRPNSSPEPPSPCRAKGNARSWFYRLGPTANHRAYRKYGRAPG